MYIKQVSVFLENKKGTLYELTKIMGKAKIDFLALSIADTENFGIVRCILREEDIDKALEILRADGYMIKVNNVVCAAVPHRPSGLSEILGVLENNEISVEYLYSFMFTGGDEAYIVIRPGDKEACVKALTDNGVKLACQADVDSIK